VSGERHREETEEASLEAPVAEALRYRVKLPVFEGPLDLLLFLIKKHEIDILDIPVAFITAKYLEYLDLMRVLNLDVAGEYLLMAATLAHIKSKMLLPRPAEAEDEEDEIDPRADLVRRLLQYQKFKQAAEELSARELLYRDVFPRGVSPEDAPREDAPLAEVSVFQLLEAFAGVLERVGGKLTHEVVVDRMSVTERIQELVERLATVERVSFDDLFADTPDVPLTVVTFLALLEMARLKMLRLYQAEPGGTIWIVSTGVAAAVIDAEGAYTYRPIEPAPVPPPPPPSEEERAALAAIEGDEDDEEDEDPPPEY